jgi:hypothetical protein
MSKYIVSVGYCQSNMQIVLIAAYQLSSRHSHLIYRSLPVENRAIAGRYRAVAGPLPVIAGRKPERCRALPVENRSRTGRRPVANVTHGRGGAVMDNVLTRSKQIDITRPTLAGNQEHRNRDLPASLLCSSCHLSILIVPLARRFPPRSRLLPVFPASFPPRSRLISARFPTEFRVSRLLPARFPPPFRLQRVHSLHLNHFTEVFPW